MTFNKFLMCLLIVWLCTTTLSAQKAGHVKLLDEVTFAPIVGAIFLYDTQSGISNEQGTIEFIYTEGSTMKLSHVNYGKWQLDDLQVKDMIQQQQHYRESIPLQLYPVTIIAVKSKEIPSDKLQIDYQDRMAHDGATLLNQTPAINSIRKSGNYGFDPVFRGFKYDQLNIVMNGAQSATAACPNRMDPPTSQMVPNMTDRIEILKGPHALRYGAGFGGTINFVSSKPRFSEQSTTYGRLSGGYESNSNIFRSEAIIGFSGQKYDAGVFSSWSQGNDYTAGNDSKVQADFSRGSFGANLGLRLTDRQQLQVLAIYNLARDADFPALPMDLREDDTWMFNARHEISINKGRLTSWNTTVFGSFVDHLMNNFLNPLDPRMVNAETLATTYNFGGRTEAKWQYKYGILFTGADLRVEGAEGTRVREFLMGPNAGNTLEDNAWQNGRISKTGLFAEYNFNKYAYRFVFSGRLELNNADISDPRPEFTQIYAETQETRINPSFSLGVSRDLKKNTAIGLWMGRTERSGSLTERFINYFPVGQDPFEMLGNPDIKPETNNQVDLNFTWSTNKTALNVDVFASYLQDFISSVIDTTLSPRLPNSPGVRQFVNIDEAFKTGFEINWTQDLLKGLQHQLGIAYTYAQDLERDEPLPEIAPLDFRYTLRGNYLKNKLQTELIFRHVLEQSRIATEFGETVSPEFSLLDVKVYYKVSDTFKLSTGINNIMDENYYEHLNRSVRGAGGPIFAQGRNFFASFNLKF
ncbi:TonB-dependent receptor [Fulvivirga sp. M361]|uniref:TonB-dependent receptor domain-containing protein n=1 Tax=Fulvivirga sp. M361 TaxID=2594266 RepID=UPI00117A32A1|nr:TonB-dependent receptor [Fulvivirga sp. M361]TRX59021.1 TonB-dependent receptor [Fulvivirga sp. M361]